MIKPEKRPSAFQALHRVLVVSRLMAHAAAPHALLAQALDGAEYLVVLLSAAEDRTDDYRRHLVDLCRLDSMFQSAVDAFDQEQSDS